MSIMDEYGAMLIYEKFRYLTIPNFISSYISFVSNGFSGWGCWFYTNFTPFCFLLCKQQETHFYTGKEMSIIQHATLYSMNSEFSIGLHEIKNNRRHDFEVIPPVGSGKHFFKLFDGLGHGFVRYVDVAVHGGFDAAVPQQLL